jgi:hypothetical protein
MAGSIDIKPGDVFHEKGYMSTSTASGFGGQIKMKIIIPPGSKVLAIKSQYASEREFLLNRDSKFEVLEVQKSGSQTILVMELING